MPPRNDGVKAWDEHSAPTSSASSPGCNRPSPACSTTPTSNLARLIAFLETAGLRDNTLILVLSRQRREPGRRPARLRQRHGPVQSPRPSRSPRSCARIDDIGGPDTHTNFPHGWAMASNTPLRRYKQNTHGGGIRDPLVISLAEAGSPARGELRHQFAHASDLAPTLLELVGVSAAGDDRRRRANADRRRQLRRQLDRRRRGAVEIVAAIFRDVRPSRHLARGLEGGRLSPAGHAVRERQMGAVSSRPRFLGSPTTSPRTNRKASRS